MRKPLIGIACALALAGCQTTDAEPARGPVAQSSADLERVPGYVRPTDAKAIEAGKRAAIAKLKDPDSAKFTDVARKTAPNLRGQPTDVICGKVNAKNSYGGYVGGKPFVYFVADGSATLSEDLAGPDVVQNFCPELLR